MMTIRAIIWMIIISVSFSSILIFHLLSRGNASSSSSSSSSFSSSSLDTSSILVPPPVFTLSNNITLPYIGLGTASGVQYPHIYHAITNIGYRFVDTAQSYHWGYREDDAGNAVRDATLRYEDTSRSHASKGSSSSEYVFVQTKIHPQDLGFHSTQKALQRSIERLHVTMIDSVLIHKPYCWEDICSHPPEGTWHDAWTVLEEAMDAGIVRSIGMCDVNQELFHQLLSKRIRPMIVQNWFDPFHQDREFRHVLNIYNQQHPPSQRIIYQGYSTLGTQWVHTQNPRGYTNNPVLNSPILQTIATKYGVTIPQVIIQWATRQGVMVLPASTNPSHQESNFNSYSFTLSDEDMHMINDMDGKLPPITTTTTTTTLSDNEVKEGDRKHPDEVAMTFINHMMDGVVNVYWIQESRSTQDHQDDDSDNERNNNYIHVGTMKGMGDVLSLTSYHGHMFVFKKEEEEEEGGSNKNQDDDDRKRKWLNRHVVDKSLGPMQQHKMEDDWSEEEEL